MRKSNLTYEKLIELAPKDRPFQIEYTTYDNKKDVLWASIVDTFENGDIVLFTDFIGTQTGKYEFADNLYYDWENSDIAYTLIDEYRNIYEKPEVLEVGTEVEILKNILGALGEIEDLPVGKIAIIEKVVDNNHGLKYRINTWYVPHYCVRPVEKVEEKEEIITVNGKKYKLIEE